jgi:hypothetical protein
METIIACSTILRGASPLSRLGQPSGAAAVQIHDDWRGDLLSPNTFDMQTALEQWVERGIAPGEILATHSINGVVDRSRPLCAYPKVAAYKGTGDTNEAANFECRDPRAPVR